MDCQTQIEMLRAAELQFRLASAVKLATTVETQPLDLPVMWTHGRHQVPYNEIALTAKEADIAAFFLQRAATYLMAAQIQEAITWFTNNQARNHSDANIRSTFEIARLVRNAFTHQPLHPRWSIDPFCGDKRFSVLAIIELNTVNLQGKEFDWRHYGGPLALLRLSEYVRCEILGDKSGNGSGEMDRTPKTEYHQQGNLILRKLR